MSCSEDLARDLELYAVTDSQWLGGRALEDVVEEVIEGGVTLVQLREKHASHEDRCELARRVAAVCRVHGVPFVVDDDIACACEVGADGVHVGQSDASCREARAELGPDAIVGVSVQTAEQARRAAADGASYLGAGAVFGTTTKSDAELIGIDGLAEVCAATDLPVVAIGGITADKADELSGCGISGIAVVSALFAAADPLIAAQALRRAADRCTGRKGR